MINMNENKVTQEFRIHYYIKEGDHSMDAFVRNQAEKFSWHGKYNKPLIDFSMVDSKFKKRSSKW